jgi:hypothetical protein
MQSDTSTDVTRNEREPTHEELKRELAHSRRREAAIAEVLRIIGSSPTDVQPVFETIAASCKRLLGARSAVVLRLAERKLKLAAFTPVDPAADWTHPSHPTTYAHLTLPAGKEVFPWTALRRFTGRPHCLRRELDLLAPKRPR